MESSERYESGTFQAFMTGALVGAGIALLFAPQAGSQLRSLLRDYVTRSTKEFNEAVERGTNMLDETIDSGHELLEKGKESVQQVRRQAKGFAEASSSAVKGIQDELVSPNR
jgi:gas vesicle protein